MSRVPRLALDWRRADTWGWHATNDEGHDVAYAWVRSSLPGARWNAWPPSDDPSRDRLSGRAESLLAAMEMAEDSLRPLWWNSPEGNRLTIGTSAFPFVESCQVLHMGDGTYSLCLRDDEESSIRLPFLSAAMDWAQQEADARIFLRRRRPTSPQR